MHDPMTVAFEIKRPWPAPPFADTTWRYWPALVTIWHVDPERHGDENSCDWFNRKGRRIYIPARWHVWHWQIQIHPVQDFKRWAWSRCCRCGGRFTWGYCPISTSWSGRGPRWFKGETDVHHHECPTPPPPRSTER